MPWKVTEPMNEKECFVSLAQTGRFTISNLCKDFGISRKTGHKYLLRYEESHMGSFQESHMGSFQESHMGSFHDS